MDDLASLVMRHIPQDGMYDMPVPGLALIRYGAPTDRVPVLHQPALCIIAQGAKVVTLAEESYRYDPASPLVVSVDLPLTGQVVEASPERPYVCIRIDLEPALLSELMLERPSPPKGESFRGLHLSRSTPELLDAATRLVRLPGAPGAARDPLLAVDGRPSLDRPPDRRRRQPPGPGEPGDSLDPRELRPAVQHRGPGARRRHERLVPAPPLQDRHGHEPAPVPEADPPAGGSPPDAQRGARRPGRGVRGGLRKPLPILARVRPPVWRPARPGRRPPARKRALASGGLSRHADAHEKGPREGPFRRRDLARTPGRSGAGAHHAHGREGDHQAEHRRRQDGGGRSLHEALEDREGHDTHTLSSGGPRGERGVRLDNLLIAEAPTRTDRRVRGVAMRFWCRRDGVEGARHATPSEMR